MLVKRDYDRIYKHGDPVLDDEAVVVFWAWINKKETEVKND